MRIMPAPLEMDRLVSFPWKTRLLPALSAHIKLEEELKSVCYSDQYVGVIVENPEGESDYRLDVYSAGGKLKFSKPVSFQYKEIDIDGDMVILYNENSCEIYNMSGKCRFSGSFDFTFSAVRAGKSGERAYFHRRGHCQKHPAEITIYLKPN